MVANQKIEQIEREDIEQIQLERLEKQLRWAQEKSRFYQEKFERAGVSWKDFHTLGDIRKFPFLESAELHQVNPLDIVTLPMSQMLRCGFVGRDARRLLKLYTAGDIQHNVEMMMRALLAVGINRTSVVGLHGSMSDSRLMDMQYALENIGATVVPMGDSYQQQDILERVGMDTLISTPQLVMQLIVQMQALGQSIGNLSLQRVLCINDMAIQNPMQRHIQERLRAKVYNFYAPPEIGISGMLYPCESRQGQHIQEDFYYPEIVAFHSSEVIEGAGQMGELVVTTLAAEAMPLIRYRTGQAVMLETAPCACGRTLKRVVTPFTMR